MKNILITNDDGIDAPALDILREKLSVLGNIVIVAPNVPRNATGNAMTLHKPVRVTEVDNSKYAVTGTPTDCVRVGVLTILNDNVDIVISGINKGANLGDDVNYSGTVAAAREAVLLGIPALASSLVIGKEKNYIQAAEITLKVAENILEKNLSKRILLNLNVPDLKTGDVKGVKITNLGIRIYDRKVREREDPIGEKYYWILGGMLNGVKSEGSDMKAIDDGYASLTPVSMDYTAYNSIKELENWVLY